MDLDPVNPPDPGHGAADRRILAYAAAVHRWRWAVIFLSLAAVALFSWNARLISIASDYRIFFSERNPELSAYENLEQVYTKNDNIMFVVRAPEGSLFTPDRLTAIWGLTEEAWQVPFSRRVDSITNFQHTEANGDDLIVRDLVDDPGALTAAGAARVEAIAMGEVELLGALLARDGHTTAVNVKLQFSDQSRNEIAEAAGAAYSIAEEFRLLHPDLEIEVSGFAALSQAFNEAPRKDAVTIIPLMYGVFALLLIFFFRSLGVTLATFTIVLSAAAVGMGVAGITGTPLTPVSAMAPNIIVTVAIANCVHLFATACEHMRTGATREEAIAESLRVNMKPVSLSGLTTAIGFLSLNFSDAPPFWHLGNLTAAGVVAAWALSMTLLPALMPLVSLKAPRTKEGASMYDRLAEFVIARRRQILAGSLVVSVLLIAAIPRLEINDKPFEYFDHSVDIRTATEFTIKHLTGVYGISYSLSAGEAGGIADPAYLAKVDAFAEWLRAKPQVAHVGALTDVLKRLNRDFHGGADEFYRLPDNRGEAAQYLLAFEMSLPYGLDLNDRINLDYSAARFDVTFGDVDFIILNRLADEADQWLVENGLPSMRGAHATSQAMMFSHISKRNINSMTIGTLLAFSLIALTLIIALKDIRIGLISLVPNMLPVVLAFGIWALVNGQVNLAVSIVAAVSIGIIVDDTVHFLAKYKAARQLYGLSPEDAVRRAFSRVGRALFITSVVIALGFAMLVFSPFFINAVMGLLTALTVVIALVLDFLLLPALLLTIDRRDRLDQRTTPGEAT